MPNYRRSRGGNVYFFTVVTHRRRPILCLEESRTAFREVVDETRISLPFRVDALVLMPDHLHCIWTLPEGDSDYSKRWGLIKAGFTKRMGRALAGNMSAEGRSRSRRGEGTVWQRRFWEHRVRDERDYEAHCDYIHYNPVKHGLVKAPKDWAWSTFRRYVSRGLYPLDWGAGEKVETPEGIGGE